MDSLLAMQGSLSAMQRITILVEKERKQGIGGGFRINCLEVGG